MRADTRNALAVVVGIALATLTVFPLTTDRLFWVLSVLGVAALCAVGLALRRQGCGVAVVASTQLLALLVGSLLLAVVVSGDPFVFDSYPQLWAQGVQHMQTQSSPMAPDGGVTLIFVTVVALVGLVTDLLVAGIDRPAWAIAPLATLFCVPALGLNLDTGLFSFLCVALGYLGVLVADGLNRAAAWTRGLSSDSSGRSVALGVAGGAPSGPDGESRSGAVVWRAAGLLAVPALVLTAIFGLLLPTISIPGFGLGNGPGGNGPLQLTDPSLDLKRNLTQPSNRVVFRYTSDQPGGVYLRMASLPQFSMAGFGNTQIRLNTGDTLPAIPGYTGPAPQLRTTSIEVDNFSSQYLPLPYAPRVFRADGEWSYNANSLVVVNRDNRPDALRTLRYTVQSADIAPSAEDLARSGTAAPADADVTSEVPADLPPELVALSRRVTEDATTPAAKAAAIQDYLRDKDNFTYDTQQRPGSGYQALVNFLTVDKRGYCEQFATAMAMMARVNGIPSRVAVGFLPGQRNGNQWQVSVNDMHAWPELYFANYGWVRFEPTPAVQTGDPPPWTVQGSDRPTTAPSQEPSSDASSAAPTQSTAPSQAPTQAPDTPAGSTSTLSLRTVLLGVGGVLLLLVLAAPATIRVRRRQTRLDGQGPAGEQVEAAWAEIRDTVLDYGGSWPSGTPRRVGAELGERLDPAEREAVGRVATLVERSRYARSLEEDAQTRDLPGTTQHIRRAISEPAGPFRRLGAVLAPRSLFRRR